MKYFCDNEECEVKIFTEQNDLVNQYSQFTERCRSYMLKVATVVSCEAAVKILAYQGIHVCGDTLLNMLKAVGKAYESSVGKKIGVDDWAYRKGQKYGTLICDLETHEIIDILKGRDRETFEKWLQGHPDIEVVSRDRASEYSSAVSRALPEAVQIADRFHITKNLLEALNDTMKAFIPEIVEVPGNEAVELKPAEVKRTVKKTRKPSSARPPR
jgi:transposase